MGGAMGNDGPFVVPEGVAGRSGSVLLIDRPDAPPLPLQDLPDACRIVRAGDLAEARRLGTGAAFEAVLLRAGPEGVSPDLLRGLPPHLGNAPLLLLVDPDHEDGARDAVRHGTAQDYLVLGHFGGGLLERALAYAVSRRRMQESLKELRRRELQRFGLDRLTALPNRAIFLDGLAEALLEARQGGGMGALLLIGLEGFRLVQDTLGPPFGDPLLREIVARLRSSIAPFLGPKDVLSRISSDEIALLLACPEDMATSTRAAEAALAAFSEPFVLQGLEFFISLAVGISVYPFDGGDASTLLRNADVALGRARERGAAGYEHFLPAVDDRFLTRLELQNGLRLGLARDEFVVHYMPQMDLRSGRLTSFEALVRWRHPARGLVPPGDFIPLAEESGLILPIGERVLRAACVQSRDWRRAGLPPVRLSVNFSARQFQHQNPLRLVTRVLEDTGLEASALELEITESAVMKDADAALATLRSLKTLGVRLSIDDFGTGYSSLSYLRSFPIDALKVDRSFVRDVAVRGEDRAIVAAVIALGHSLGLRVIAEGVETTAHLDCLRELGCDEVQGYHVGRPVPPEAAAAMQARLRPE
jgi:diguanylate cyclase (GGDEF)-like protein